MATTTNKTAAPYRFRPSLYTLEKSNDYGQVFYVESPTPYAIGYYGRSSKPSFHNRFRSVERMHEQITGFLDGLVAAAGLKEQRRAARKAVSAYQYWNVGDIIVNSWGYDQTNVDFHQVVRVGPKSVYTREIAGETVPSEGFSPMAGHTRPLKDQFKSEEVTMRRVGEGGNVGFKFGGSRKHEEGAKYYESWYA
jgi:hypothetical protein